MTARGTSILELTIYMGGVMALTATVTLTGAHLLDSAPGPIAPDPVVLELLDVEPGQAVCAP